jgi:hypothetical protein
MRLPIEHEHWFVDHEDPRWLYCDCGQYAVRARNIAGDRIVRLIDPPQPMFVSRTQGSRTTTTIPSTPDVSVREHDLV